MEVGETRKFNFHVIKISSESRMNVSVLPNNLIKTAFPLKFQQKIDFLFHLLTNSING